MFPLELRIEHIIDPASFEIDGEAFAHSFAARYRITAVVLDAENRRTLSYEFSSMIEAAHDEARDPYVKAGKITIAPTSAQLEKLRKLRDALNELLGEDQ